MESNNNYKKWQDLVRTQYEEKQLTRAEKALIDEVENLFKSTFIFPIAQLEERFGHLWGIDKEDEGTLTEEERVFDELFEGWRDSVLDMGNKQIRLFKRIMIKYVIEFNKVKFKMENKNGNG